MPRSGTTLIEQILASHPEVYGGGELAHIDTASKQLGKDYLSGRDTVSDLPGLDTQTLTRLADQYINNATHESGSASRITDKMPHNFKHIGLISLMFPNARIIHCTRNPVDTCLSIYFNNFNAMHAYAGSLETLADYYTDFYQVMMVHWKTVDTVPVLDVSYEALVEDMTGTTRQMLEFCGLGWSDACLEFYKSKRDVATPSYDQVRQPIYTKSLSRWRNYRDHVTDLLKRFPDSTGTAVI